LEASSLKRSTRPVQKGKKSIKRIVVFPDCHAPNQDRLSVWSCLQFIKHYKPTHFIQLGDLCDWDSLSVHEARRESDLTDINLEIREANNLLDEIEAVLPKKCEKTLVGGNHEARYARFSVSNRHDTRVRQLHDFTTWENEYGLSKRGWRWCQYGEYYELGKIIFTHGWFSSGNHAQRHLGLYHKNIIYGHTHQFQVATSVGLDGHPVMAASIGTLSKMALSYLVGKPPVNWIHMFAYIDMHDNGTFSPHFVPIVNGRFFELGKVFEPKGI